MKKKTTTLFSLNFKLSAVAYFLFFSPSLPGDDDDAVFVDMCQRFWTCLLLLMEESPGSGIKHLDA